MTDFAASAPRSRVQVDTPILLKNTGLTAEQLAPARTARRVYVNEPGLPGLHVVIAPSGSVSWAFIYVNAKGERRSAKLAAKRAANAMLMDRVQAVDLARRLREKALAGQDVLEERAEQAKAHATELARIKASRKLVIEVVEAYANYLEETNGSSHHYVRGLIAEPTPATLRRYAGVGRAQLKPILAVAALPVTKFTAEHAKDVLRAYEARGVRGAGRVLRAFRAAWNHVATHGSLDRAFGLTKDMNPWRDLKTTPPKGTASAKKRGDNLLATVRAVSVEEFARLFLYWNQPPKTYVNSRGRAMPVKIDRRQVLACQLIFFSGQRSKQCLSVRAQDLDLENRLWNIPFERRKVARAIVLKEETAKIKPHTVVLNDAALAVTRELLALHQGEEGGAQFGFDHLIPRIDRDGKMHDEPREPHAFVRFVREAAKSAGIAPFTPRDGRRSWKTWASKWRIPFDTRNYVQDHALPGMDANYNFDDFLAQQREAAEVFAGEWSAVLEKERAKRSNVHQLSGADRPLAPAVKVA